MSAAAAVSPDVGKLDPLSDDKSDSESDGSLYDGRAKLRELAVDDDARFAGLRREKFWQVWRPRRRAKPPPKTLDQAATIPLATASLISRLSFHWVTPILVRGYQRPLQATDLWKMDQSREANPLSTRFLERLEARQKAARDWNTRQREPGRYLRLLWMINGTLTSKFSIANIHSQRKKQEVEWRNVIRHGSIAWALNDVITDFWSAGIFKVAGDTAQMMSPLVVKSLINFSKEGANGDRPNIGLGIAMALGLWALTVFQSVCQHQFFFRSMSTGVIARATLISAIYKRSLRMSVSARAAHPNGKLVNNISSDVSRIDYCAQWFHAVWTAPIQLMVCLILLILQIGPSALVGFSLFIILGPIQTAFMKSSLSIRKKSMLWTDARAKLLRELLGSMQIIKFFTYEIPFLDRLKGIRRKEMLGIRKILIIRAANQAMAFSVPVLAAVLSFITYARTHDYLDPALIFTSLALFNLLRQPLMFLPRALSSVTDARNALDRLTEVFEAEVVDNQIKVDRDSEHAIDVKNVTFSWNSDVNEEKDQQAFCLKDLNLSVRRGALVAIVGKVGSGKSSLLQGLIGEMNVSGGQVRVGGRLAYCQQSAWIQNATVRDNVIFGQAWDEHRYWRAVKDASLITDLEILPDGDLTEIGEKGVNLSGGQRQRVNIARALYFNADIVLFDDPLSAVDAHVGRALFENAILGLKKKGATVLLVTHALHFLSQMDEIIVMEKGVITEHGSYSDVLGRSIQFAALMNEYGSSTRTGGVEHDLIDNVGVEKKLSRKLMGRAAGTGKIEGRLMVSEVRKTGTVGRKVYGGYLRAGRAKYTFPLTFLFAGIMQGAQVMSTVWLTYWESDRFGKTLDFYEGIYAFLGITTALFTFAMGASMGILSYFASNNLHADALFNIFHGPMSMFDTQPLGRILGIFGKDIDTADNQLADSLRMMAMTLTSLLGSVIIVTVFLHYFIVVILVVGIGYWYFSLYYRTSARELKRLDSMLRSLLYSHFSESLSGLATIRAYGEENRFVEENSYYMDLEDRAYLLTTANQRWLSVRLDFLGGCLVFAVAIMTANGGGGITPSEIALCLTYMVTIVQIFGMVTRQTAEVENNMNAVERILHYSDKTSLPQEKPHVVEKTDPGASWPAAGAIKFEDVKMCYRPGLPLVLKGISFDVKTGEKVGIVGRTGAGKSSITVALYRLVELLSGKISIDNVDISTLGLRTLRSKIAIIPQDPVLFSGTLRSNLDPFDKHEDARLYDAMKRACLDVDSGRYPLDAAVADDGSNFSVGERSLISLARALVKDAKIVLLDEATAAVDLQTDSHIQRTILSEFADKTLLCIAHRIRTIISWDRILVMEHGEVKAFAPPLDLYDTNELFRGMCERSEISRDDICNAARSPI